MDPASSPQPAVARSFAVSGASGFIGHALVEALRAAHPDAHVFGLGRSKRPPRDLPAGTDWRSVDLFRLKETEAALVGIDVAFYLVHAMLPTARLTQASFGDLDLLSADNFARAAKRAGVKHIVYLGGLMPEEQGDLSRHLESRREVERALGSYGTPVVALRAGMVIGAGGSSFRMLHRLVERLPAMITPRWARSRTEPIALADVVQLLVYAGEHPELAREAAAWDVGCGDVLTYDQMLRQTAEIMGKTTPIWPVPFDTFDLSLAWVSVITGAPRELVRPLVESLRHEMVVHDGNALARRAGVDLTPFRAAIARAIAAEQALPHEEPSHGPRHDGRVRSVQRLPMPKAHDVRWAAEEYLRWLPTALRSVLHAELEGDRVVFRIAGRSLLELTFVRGRSGKDRQLLMITGGLLARIAPPPAEDMGRLEFRSVLGGEYLLAAIHEFSPKLPWPVYVSTQALVHLAVMLAFGRHLARIAAAGGSDTQAPAPKSRRPTEPPPRPSLASS